MIEDWKKFFPLIPINALIFLDQTILPVALPKIQNEMQAAPAALQWSVDSYLLAIAVLVLLCGKIGDLLGHKKILLSGMGLFIGSSLFCGLSPSIGYLILARALQGVGAALMIPAQTTMIALLFPPEKRGKATGITVSIGSLFLILGPLIGGYLAEWGSWRWIFLMNVPVGFFGIWMIYRFMPKTTPKEGGIDLAGCLYFAICVSSLTALFMQGSEWGWNSLPAIVMGFLSLASLIGLLLREKTARHPFLEIKLFKHPRFTAVNISISAIQFFSMIGVFRTIYLQETLGYSASVTGWLMFSSALPVLFMGFVGGALSDKAGPKVPIAAGHIILIGSCLYLALHPTPTFTGIAFSLFAFGAGMPMIFTPSYSSAVASVPPTKIGTASGIIATLRMTAGTLGLALIHLFVSTVQKNHLSEGNRFAEIISFSYVHYALALVLLLSLASALILHSREYSPPKGGDL